MPLALSGAIYAIGAAALFGASTPFAKLLLGEVSPLVLAAALYLGSGIGLAAWIAVRARLPLIVFAGEAPLKSGWYNQELDQAPLITATGAAYHRLHLPERMPVAVRDAFLQARRERRPVVIGVPFDLQARPWEGPAVLPKPSRELLPRPSPMPPHPDDVASAAKLLAGAERVVL